MNTGSMIHGHYHIFCNFFCSIRSLCACVWMRVSGCDMCEHFTWNNFIFCLNWLLVVNLLFVCMVRCRKFGTWIWKKKIKLIVALWFYSIIHYCFNLLNDYHHGNDERNYKMNINIVLECKYMCWNNDEWHEYEMKWWFRHSSLRWMSVCMWACDEVYCYT